jgi:hypothetical protein
MTCLCNSAGLAKSLVGAPLSAASKAPRRAPPNPVVPRHGSITGDPGLIAVLPLSLSAGQEGKP